MIAAAQTQLLPMQWPSGTSEQRQRQTTTAAVAAEDGGRRQSAGKKVSAGRQRRRWWRDAAARLLWYVTGVNVAAGWQRRSGAAAPARHADGAGSSGATTRLSHVGVCTVAARA